MKNLIPCSVENVEKKKETKKTFIKISKMASFALMYTDPYLRNFGSRGKMTLNFNEAIVAHYVGQHGLGPKILDTKVYIDRKQGSIILFIEEELIPGVMMSWFIKDHADADKLLCKPYLKALKKLHSLGITHGDLATGGENVMITPTNEVKLIDLEMSKTRPSIQFEVSQALDHLKRWKTQHCAGVKMKKVDIESVVEEIFLQSQKEDLVSVLMGMGLRCSLGKKAMSIVNKEPKPINAYDLLATIL
jgi:serine/threonine protein kinase